MKDIVIKGRSVKREIIVLGICFVLVNLLNVWAIHSYGTQWRELYTVWFAVIASTALLYILTIPFRLLFCWSGKVIKKAACKDKTAVRSDKAACKKKA